METVNTSKVDVKLNIPANSSEGGKHTHVKSEISPGRKRIEVTYSTDIISESMLIEPDGFSSIRFRNIGEDNAKILDVIPLDPSDAELNLSNDIYCKIINKIRVSFAGLSSNKQIVVIKTYFNDL